MTKEEAIEQLKQTSDCDQEMAHSDADEIILQYLRENGAAEVADAWEESNNRCGGFWYA